MSYNPDDAKSIFLQAAELMSSAERAAFLERVCAGKPALKARVESLLKTALDPDSLLDQPVADFGATQMVSQDAPPVSLDFLEPCEVPGRLGRLGGYEILEVIGRGGMGIVLRAMDVKLNRVVAIKVLAPELASNPQARKRFLREAQAAAAVSHDHVVTIHAVDDDEKVPFLVMECIVGHSLQQKIDNAGALGLKEILRIGMQIASGLAAAHKQGLVHRDIKPANVLLENGVERVKITDFGLARATDDVGITQSGQITGTPQYMSPEQAMGQPVDQRSDLFSLGSVLFTLCTGRPAFRADSAVAVLRRVCDDTPRPIGEVNAEVPDWLIAIVNRLMAKKPEDRIQTAAEVADLLSQHLAHLQQPTSVPAPARLPSQRLPVPGTSSRRRRSLVMAALAVGLLCCVVAFYGLTTGRLTVEVEDPSLRLEIFPIGNSKSKVHLPASPDRERFNGRIAAGNYYIVAYRGDNTTHLARIDILRGQSRSVRLTLDDVYLDGQGRLQRDSTTRSAAAGSITVPTPDGKPFDPFHWKQAVGQVASDRTAAEWVLSIHGTVRINDGDAELNSASELPSEPFRLTAVDLKNNPDVTTAGLACFADCRHLRSLRLSSPGLTTEGLAHFKNVGDLTHLNLGGSGLTEAGIKHFRTCRSLTHITLTGLGVTDAALAHVRELPQLELLSLTGTHITDAGLTALHSAKQLRDLNVAATDVTADGIDSLKRALPQCRIAWSGGLVEPTQPVAAKKGEPPANAAGTDWQSLFNGRDLTGWKPHAEKPGDWKVENSLLVGRSPLGYLMYDGSAGKSFHLRAETRINHDGYGAIVVHPAGLRPDGAFFGVWASINSTNEHYKTGHLIGIYPNYSHAGGELKQLPAPGEWFTLEVISLNGRVSVRVNGVTTHEIDQVPHQDDQIALTVGNGASVIEFRKIDVQWLPAPAIAPFEAAQAKAHQEAWAKHRNVEVERTNSIGMKFRLIPPGEFTMGTAAGAADRLTANPDWYFARWLRERRQAEGPPRVVRISQPMYVGTHEVTVGQFAEFLKDTEYKTEAETHAVGGYSWRDGAWQRDATARWHNPGFLQTHDHPVSNIAWTDAVAFCEWLSRKEGVEYRLPREAEWEYSCRAGSTALFSTGDNPASLEGFANIADAATLTLHQHLTWSVPWNDGFAFTAPVGSFKPNNFGLFDMHGNVPEWCFDWYDNDAYAQSPATDPHGPAEGSWHVYRGGGWDNWIGFCRSADRYSSHSDSLRTQWAGFRVVLELTNQPQR